MSEQNSNMNMLFDRTESNHQQFITNMIDFIHSARLNKTTTNTFLSLLRSKISFPSIEIPKSTDALWKKLEINFYFEKFDYCSTCFNQLPSFQDTCGICGLKDYANSEL